MNVSSPKSTLKSTLKSLALLAALLLPAACGGGPGSAPAAREHAGAPDHGDAQAAQGPHGGRLLSDGDFALELQIFEQGVPPEYRVYLYRDGEPLPPHAAEVEVVLTRLGDEVERFAFTPRGDHLVGDGVVREPHSFSVAVTAREDGQRHAWRFDSFEGRTTIPAPIAAAAGVRTARAGPATIAEVVELSGRIVPDRERVRRLVARFPGTVTQVTKSAGDPVARGEPLAVIESDESLKRYTLASPIDGIVVERHANAGEHTGSEPLFVVADYARLWAELWLFPRDLARVAVGQSVALRGVDGDLEGSGRIIRIAPANDDTRGALGGVYSVRVALDNAAGRWLPGLFVRGSVQVDAHEVPLAVRRDALQAFRDFTVVFERIGDTYEVRMLELGRRDGTHVEVLGGLRAGAEYVADNSYLIKADVEKSGASHDH